MGYRTIVLLNNDAFNELTTFSKQFFSEVSARLSPRPIDPSFALGMNYPAATVLECNHTSVSSVISVEGLCGRILGEPHQTESLVMEDERILRLLAERLGYTLRRRPTPQKK